MSRQRGCQSQLVSYKWCKVKLIWAGGWRRRRACSVRGIPATLNRKERRGGAAARAQVVEEVMSIADGQVVLVPGRGGAPAVDPAASISRIGGRAYPPALAALAPALRFELAQARDAPSAAMSHIYQSPQGPTGTTPYASMAQHHGVMQS